MIVVQPKAFAPTVHRSGTVVTIAASGQLLDDEVRAQVDGVQSESDLACSVSNGLCVSSAELTVVLPPQHRA